MNSIIRGRRSIFALVVVFAASGRWTHAATPARAEVNVSLSPAGSFVGKVSRVNGSAYRTAGGGVAAKNVSIDLSTITTGVGLRDKHTKEHLEVARYPRALLIQATGRDGRGEALVEIHGVKQKVTGSYVIDGDVLKAEFPLALSKVKISDVRYMGVGVKDQVTVKIELPLVPARATAGARAK